MKEIAVIAPIQEVYRMAKEIVKERGYENIEVIHGNMSQGLRVAQKAVAEGAKIIVSRGGTYRMIKENCKASWVEILVTAYDIVESFNQVPRDEPIVGIVGYDNIIYGVELLKKMIRQPIEIIEIHKEEDVYCLIQAHKERGIKTYVGDANILQIAQELDCRGILIGSQKESVYSAIREARRISRATKEEKLRTRQIVTMTDFIHDGIIAVDEAGRITVFNKMASDIFGYPQQNAIGKNIADIVPFTKIPRVLETGMQELGDIQSVNNAKIASNRIPILVDGEVQGAVATFQDVTEVQDLEQKIRQSLNEKGFVAKYSFDSIIHASAAIDQCIDTARKFAQYDTPVHLCGASGVGKELFCQGIHNASPRKHGPFVAVNCAAIPPSLIESELFGYAEGSFTGAARNGKPGIFELAHNGTLFLDEISEIPMDLQGRLLRILQEKQVMRVGGDKIIPVNVKIITASNRYLKELAENGKFRKDLFFRINVLTLRIPTLAKRPEDIPVLARHFIEKYARKYHKEPLEITPGVEAALLGRQYEGNVRELEGLMEKCVIVSSLDGLLEESGRLLPQKSAESGSHWLWDMDLATMEQMYIHNIYNKNGKNVKKTCDILKISRTTLWRKMKDSAELL